LNITWKLLKPFSDFTDWLMKPMSLIKFFSLVLTVTAFKILLFPLLAGFLKDQGFVFSTNIADLGSRLNQLDYHKRLLWIVYKEELIFRMLPIVTGVMYLERTGYKRWLFLLILVFSVRFGYIHGTYWNILIQGVAGFLYCIIFLKAGGNQFKFFQALFVTGLVHYSYNILLEFR
jgi:hypothetical protein